MSKKDKRTIREVFIIFGIITAAFLIILGSISWCGYRFITDNVRSELVAQKIYFPAKGSAALDPTEFPTLQKYAGQIVDDGIKAKAYANDFISKHLEKIGNGKTYSEISAEAIADPTNQTLQDEALILFRGTTLRSMLLSSGYAFWTFGLIAKYVAIASFVSAGIIVIFACLGMRNLKKLK